MNRFFSKTTIFVSLLFITLNIISAFPLKSTYDNKNETLIIKDSDSRTGLPDRYRNISNLNISGSAQFTKEQVSNLKNTINKPDICVIDLRQESHGIINDYAISFFSRYKDLNNGFTVPEVIKTENSLLNKIKIKENLNIYKKTGILFKEVVVDFVSNESSIVINSEMQYKRYAVKDNFAPTPETVDEFIEFIKTKPSDLHLHFHCDAGEGRTTTFMSMYQIMMNSTGLSLDQILTYQYNIGGININNNKYQFEFLEEFFNYVLQNKKDNYSNSYSDWIDKSSESSTSIKTT